MKRKILAVTMSLIMAASLAACGGSSGGGSASQDGSGSSQSSTTSDSSSQQSSGGTEAGGEQTQSALPDSLENANLVILWDTTEDAWNNTLAENPDAFNLVWTTKKAFEEKYGGSVQIIGVEWGAMKETATNMVNAGEVCDLVQANDQTFPIYGAKGIVQDVSKYINLHDGFWYDSVTEAFTYNGVPYAAGADAGPVVISYNKTLFEQYGVKTPGEYFEEGNWTWDTFRQVALDMTGDTDGDGNNDIYGFGWWDGFYSQMMATNGITAINYNGEVGSNYLTKQAEEAFTFMQNGYTTDKFIQIPDGDKFIADFKSGKLAMTCEYGFGAITAYPCDYEIAWAPLPTGPSGQKYDCGGSLTGFAIPVTSANPEGAAVFARMAYELLKEYNASKQIALYGQEQVDLMNTLGAHIKFTPIGIEKYWDANWTIFSGLTDGTPVSTFSTNADEQIKEGISITLGK